MVMSMIFAFAALATLMPSLAFAGAAPQPSLRNSPSPLLGFGLMFLMVVVVVAISFMPSKRSHLD